MSSNYRDACPRASEQRIREWQAILTIALYRCGDVLSVRPEDRE